MKIFVSYSRIDNDLQALRRIEKLLAEHGEAYLDDLHFPSGGDRKKAVLAALERADVFVAVISPSYLQTDWTKLELKLADKHRIPIYALHGNTLRKIGSPDDLLNIAANLPPERRHRM